MKSGETIELHFPSLGVMSFIKTYAKNKTQRGQQFDKAFLRYAPFLIADYKGFSDRDYDKLLQESYSWSIQVIPPANRFTSERTASTVATIGGDVAFSPASRMVKVMA